MDNFVYVIRLIGLTYFTDKTRYKKFPFLVLNWVATVAAGIFLWNVASTSGNLGKIAITAGIFILVLAIIFGRAAILTHFRTKRRKYLYKIWKNEFGLKEYSDYDKDSSRFLLITWNGMRAESLHMQGTAGNSSLTSIKDLKAAVENMNKSLAVKGYKWVLDYEQLRIGNVEAHIVPTSSLEFGLFLNTTRVCEMSYNVISYSDMPKVSFAEPHFENGVLTFTSVTLENLEAQVFSSNTLDNMTKAFSQYYPAPKGMSWRATNTNGNVVITTKQGLLSDAEMELIQEARDRDARSASYGEPLNVAADTTKVGEPSNILVTEATIAPLTGKNTLPPLPPRPKFL